MTLSDILQREYRNNLVILDKNCLTENEELLLKTVMEKLNITVEDMNKKGFIKEKLREINIDSILS